MKKQEMKRLIAKARNQGVKRHMKIKHLEYQIKFGEYSLALSFSIN
ncbi:hypothetical protein ACFL5G_03160 [Candidatus Margulisiibacteriota bacterium]